MEEGRTLNESDIVKGKETGQDEEEVEEEPWKRLTLGKERKTVNKKKGKREEEY